MKLEGLVLRPVIVQFDELSQFHEDVDDLPFRGDRLPEFRFKFREDIGLHGL
jgi:hypothetical protein